MPKIQKEYTGMMDTIVHISLVYFNGLPSLQFIIMEAKQTQLR